MHSCVKYDTLFGRPVIREYKTAAVMGLTNFSSFVTFISEMKALILVSQLHYAASGNLNLISNRTQDPAIEVRPKRLEAKTGEQLWSTGRSRVNSTSG